jgi:FtsP/CotA-like multicopper oxidase with cupredoxin domain
MMIRSIAGGCAVLGIAAALTAPGSAQQTPAAIVTPPPACRPATALPAVPEIRSQNGKLKAQLTVTDGMRTIWDGANSRCTSQYLRYFAGHSLWTSASDDPAFAAGDPLPGPTFRSRVGDLVEIEFLNHINNQHFPISFDRGDQMSMAMHEHDPLAGCDITLAGAASKRSSKNLNADKFPNCIHGSNTTNVHFHGTHTTPSTTGDNVLLFVRPAIRTNGAFLPSDGVVRQSFNEFFSQCERKGYPSLWGQMPLSWRTAQSAAITWYDTKTPFQGGPQTLPRDVQLGPVNAREIAQGLWPQYQIGATPYCFPLPAYVPGGKYKMGQSPGTHWYHAHKHGSTALNVANGMVGAFIIEGKYDDDLRAFYRSNPNWDFQDRVLVIQQLTSTLSNTNPTGTGPHTLPVPALTVNGRRSPVITMRPNQVQLFRFINGAERDAALFQNFVPQGSTASCSRQTQNPCVHWNQTAQDGVQLKAANYDPGNTGTGYVGRAQDSSFNLAPANRADLLVQAPPAPGKYDLHVQAGLCRFDCSPQQEVLLTVSVEGAPVQPAMPFVPVQSFPTFPEFLADIQESEIFTRRSLVFQDNAGALQINGKQFDDHVINQSMLLNSVEEWTISNLDGGKFGKEHPFHIHINPFQIVEVFEPQSPNAQRGGSCYADPLKPETWKPCSRPSQDFVWWDTFAIPASRTDTVPCTTVATCPPAIRNKVTCSAGACQVTISGYFKMRTRFMDFTGQYVLHCHILTHEDRGMMELIEVVPDYTLYTHH